MGYFTKDEASSPLRIGGALEAVSADRVAKALERRGWSFTRDDDGDIITGFDDGMYFLIFYGDEGTIQQVRGRWRGILPASEAGRATEFCAEWNRSKLWPKTYVDVVDEMALLITESTVDFAAGVSDEQLDTHLGCAISTSEMFFEACADAFPDAAAAYRE